jgi:hypothetical protein
MKTPDTEEMKRYGMEGWSTISGTLGVDCKRPRRMPQMWQIADYWLMRGTFGMRVAEPWCFACRITATPDFPSEPCTAALGSPSGR